MRIFQLNTVCGIKSTGRIAAEIGRLVEAEGGVCRIGTGANPVPPHAEHMAYKTLSVFQRKLYTLMIRYFDADGFWNRIGTRRLIREMERFQPDVIHLHNIHGGYLHAQTLFRYLKQKNLPVVWTLHDCWPFTGHCAYFDYSGCQRWLTDCHHCPQKGSYPVCVGLDRSRSNHQRKRKAFTGLPNLTMVVPCRWMQQPLSQSFLRDNPVRVIYNGVDLTSFHPMPSELRQQHGIAHGKLILAVAAEWDERKGLRYLIKAAEKLGSDYHFVVIGLSPEQIATLPEGMLGIQHTANVQELAQWYTAADCLANPSMEDNMPMVNLEALACGTPIAAFRTGGTPEALDEATGIVVDKADVDGLCNAIRALTPKTPERTEACLRRAQRFDTKQTFEEYLRLYRELQRG
ncbi:MAG: glycosyltransferase [Clostridia bacterium]|nr:glycosyltransferase [Clostridia bacterium]